MNNTHSQGNNAIIVIGGGAAGFFGAIACAQRNPANHVILLEKARQVLAKVRVSGGGRCNVTHACFDPAILVRSYPRGGKALRGPFAQFQPRDTIDWFESRGVKLKVESDGRMFPVTDSSETIIKCLVNQAKSSGVQLMTECGVEDIKKTEKQFSVLLSKGKTILCDRLLIATGSNPKVYKWLETLGHTIESPVPSLFTFNIPNSPLQELAGISVPNAHLKLSNTSLEQTGPLLITHWGFSGPAVLKLSAWGARVLHEMDYKAELIINWIPELSRDAIKEKALQFKNDHPAKSVSGEPPFELPRNLWRKLAAKAGITSDMRWSGLSNKHLLQLIETLERDIHLIDGKSTYKEEFVTCGGIKLDEVNFKTMESKICPGIFFAGEVLDIDGITGGFNFQSAWTTSWIAGNAMAEYNDER